MEGRARRTRDVDPRNGGRGLQPEQPQAAAGRPLRAPGFETHEEDVDRVLDRRGGPHRAGRRARAAGEAARVPAAVEAAVDLRPDTPEAGAPRDRMRAHQLQSGGGSHGAAEQHRPESPEHSDPHRGGPAHPRGLRSSREGLVAVGRGLQPDRAAAHGALRRGRSLDRVVPGWRGHPRADGSPGQRGRHRWRQRRDAARGQGHQLRDPLRNGVRARSDSRSA